ncbi:DUF711 family protein [Vulcanisaeta thermophila]|uniref:DUF711 family protein n=1 Tax=Vulcanisaeta thermophila TaxID=867917 RepID=UPI000853CF20|nr:DUF711 family protein [Vulcanisaeta thermophila]
MIVRAVTLFYPVQDGHVNPEELRGELTRLKNVAQRVSAKYGVEIRTLRVTLPFLEDSWSEELITSVGSVARKLGFIHSSINVGPMNRRSLDWLVRVFMGSGSYMSIWVGDFRELFNEMVDLYVGILRRLVELNQWAESRRVAALIGEPILTPYYPDSINIGNRHGVALSLLYPRDLLGGGDLVRVMEGVFRTAERLGREIAEELNVDYLGIDTSLSPWGEESVVEVIEDRFHIRFGEPGTLSAIHSINKAIWEASKSIVSTGFNEVMLPVAEDEKLKDRVREGLVTMGKLIQYTTTCVAGIDMVPINTQYISAIRGIVEDLHVITTIKRRTMGMRIIPTPDQGETNLGDFGKTPVITPNS